MNGSQMLLDGVLVSLPFTVVVWASFRWKPRLWLHSLPADIQAMVPPKTATERVATGWAGALVLLCFFGGPIALTWRRQTAVPGGVSFADTLGYLYGVWMVVNVWDLVVIDWLYAFWMDPEHPPIPGTAGARGYKNYGFHARAFVKASVLSLVVLVPAAALLARSARR